MNTGTPAQSRFEDRLLTAILADFDQLAAAPAGTHRARGHRMVPRLALGAAAAVTAVAIAVTAGLPGQHGSVQARSKSQHGPVLKLRTAAYLVDHMRSALNENTAVVEIVEHAPDSQTGKPAYDEVWSSSRSHTDRIVDLSKTGQPVTGYLVTVTAHRTVSIVINYRAHTWSRTVYSFGSASAGRRRAGPRAGSPSQMAARLRAEVRAGQVTVAGRDTVDGQAAIQLIQRSADGLLSMWVSPTSYLPIRVIGTAPGVSPASPQAIRDDYRWLPGTPANLRLLTAADAIPAGFTRTGHGR